MDLSKLKASGIRCEVSPRALERWNPAIQAAVENTGDTITIYGVIGEDYWGQGVTVQRIDAALRAIGDKPVTVYVNSPGGDMFEGLAIYNRLREHSQPITTKVLGLAASAGSLIAMAGHERQVASAGFLMIHNCWTWLAANRHGLREAADVMEEFDAAMADLYAEVSGQPSEDMAELMDDETFIRGKRAVELSLATSLLSSDEITERDDAETRQTSAMKAMDIALAKSGMTRAQRRELFANFKPGTPRAAGGGTQNAAPTDKRSAIAPDLSASLSEASAILNSLKGESR